MTSFLPDSSCIVAAVSQWHEHHTPAAREVNARLARGEAMLLAAPALVESYSVLTRLPAGRRLSPVDALAVLAGSFVEQGRTIALDAGDYVRLLHTAVEQGTAGGGVYDAVIAACARAGGASTLLTFNARQFLPFQDDELAVVVPTAESGPQ
jgi:predicted nucleic acid-binding protein